MKATGIIRRFDDLGRIVIPKEIRRIICGNPHVEGFPMEIFIEKNTIILKPYKESNVWKPIVNPHGEIVEYICECGCRSQAATSYCPECGAKMDNSDTQKRIQETIHEADYNKGITDSLEKLNELEKQYTEQYGCEIIEMYAEVVRDFKEWLAELID